MEEEITSIQSQLSDLRKMLRIVIDHLATLEWNAATANSNLLRVRANLEETTTNALIHEELREGGETRVLESIHDQYYKEADESGLDDVRRLFRDPEESPPEKRKRRSSR